MQTPGLGSCRPSAHRGLWGAGAPRIQLRSRFRPGHLQPPCISPTPDLHNWVPEAQLLSHTSTPHRTAQAEPCAGQLEPALDRMNRALAS